jgi:hypothetical protein
LYNNECPLVDYFSDPWVIATLIVAAISIIVNIAMFLSKRKEKSMDKIDDLSHKITALDTKFAGIEGPFRTIQNELLIKGMRYTFDKQPEDVLKKIGGTQ